ncbi:oxidoreductase [Parasaccharibacter apium]|nr:oxidoreductase [Parasaccharibacter apium]
MKLFNLSGRKTLEEASPVAFADWKDAPHGTAISLPQDVEVEDLRSHLNELTLIVLEFPIFRDGRAFTQARSLREYEGYKGEIRASGHLLPDQAIHLKRCGFDSVALPEEANTQDWDEQLSRYQFYYQNTAVSPV